MQLLLQLAETYLLHFLNCVNSFIKVRLTFMAAQDAAHSFHKNDNSHTQTFYEL